MMLPSTMSSLFIRCQLHWQKRLHWPRNLMESGKRAPPTASHAGLARRPHSTPPPGKQPEPSSSRPPPPTLRRPRPLGSSMPTFRFTTLNVGSLNGPNSINQSYRSLSPPVHQLHWVAVRGKFNLILH